VLYFQLGTAAKDAFPAAWDKFMGAGSYAARIDLAKANGMVVNPNVGVMTLAGLIMGFWIFYGYYIPTFFAGEVKQAEKTFLGFSDRHLGDLCGSRYRPTAPCPAGMDRCRIISEQCRRRECKPNAVDYILRSHPQAEHHFVVDCGDRLGFYLDQFGADLLLLLQPYHLCLVI
jgi:hypothetical protein